MNASTLHLYILYSFNLYYLWMKIKVKHIDNLKPFKLLHFFCERLDF